MTDKPFDLLVFIGRFQPFHLGHKRVIDQAVSLSKKVLILIGGAGKARTVRNPFTFAERAQMIRANYPDRRVGVGSELGASPLIIEPIYDITYNDSAWIKQVQDVVRETCIEVANPTPEMRVFKPVGIADLKVGLIGASKDNTSYYLKLFPQWDSVDVPVHDSLHATGIREGFLDGIYERWQLQDTLLPKNVCDFLFGYTHKPTGTSQFTGIEPEDIEPTEVPGFIHTNQYKQLQAELRFVREYKKSWEAAPYPVKHFTVDAVVEQSGHVLLVRRRTVPGKGLWALPGGHLDPDEKTLDGMIRELREETRIKVPEPVLRGSVVDRELFDDPNRSTIGRVITHAFHIKLPDDIKLPKVRGSDDADRAVWKPIAELREDELYDDHWHIINYFLGLG